MQFCFFFFFNFRRKAATVKGHGPQSVRRGTNAVPTPEFNGQGDISLKVLFEAERHLFIILVLFISLAFLIWLT